MLEDIEMFSTRGAIFHWIIFGIVAALGLFFLLTNSFAPSLGTRGEWHLDFLYDAVYAAEIDLLALDQDARDFGQDTALQLAQNGGFRGNSSCGQDQQYQLWNDPNQWCIHNVKEIVTTLYQQHFLPRDFEILFLNNSIAGKSGRKQINASSNYIQMYTYNYDFTVDIGYNFNEYVLLEQEARALVALCRNDDNLSNCLEQKPSSWTLCEPEISSATVAFCVPSPVDAVVNNNPIRYQFALDFS
ncbi:MAG: hypothetical protein Q8R37_05575 [Nanoarchaeota archaeon]|nr:hypothetical protein [Nanoarchaeota archaeon]